MSHPKLPNKLIAESSPYLLQHAYNPVEWEPWSSDAFKLAKENNKLVIISIGYSACHWCHVMEKESFEDEQVALMMNEHFINIKVDREERPDVDNLYMTAVQLMTGHGGWPLNCIALPDGRPVYGGTYFNKQQWMNVLKNVAEVYRNEPEKVREYAQNLTEGIKQAELVASKKYPENADITEALPKAIRNWKNRFDNEHGGPKKVPKFPLPNNYLFLLRYAYLFQDQEVLNHVQLTLHKMANGGIYDPIHGGFARYSTDGLWKLPHFEKMLYDNAQLISLYSEAYRLTNNVRFKEVVEETIAFVIREWKIDEGGFCSAYDADSEGEEGKYYVWSKEELQEILKDEYDLFAAYYQVNEVGYWEDGNYILMRIDNVTFLASSFNLTLAELELKIATCKNALKEQAKFRVKPGLDDKVITSWNALMIKALSEAYIAFGNEDYLKEAVNATTFVLKYLKKENGELLRIYKNGKSKVEGFLDDYAFLIDALLSVYTISGNKLYLNEAFAFAELVTERFQHQNGVLFYYSNINYNALISQQTETSDNVIPASNSQMALNLFYLSKHFYRPNWEKKASEMLQHFLPEMSEYAAGYSNWACLALHFIKPFREVVIVGKNVHDFFNELGKHYFTNTILVQSNQVSDLPLLKGREPEEKTRVFVCENNTCGIPVTELSDVLKLLETN